MIVVRLLAIVFSFIHAENPILVKFGFTLLNAYPTFLIAFNKAVRSIGIEVDIALFINKGSRAIHIVHATDSRDLVTIDNLLDLISLGVNNGNGCTRASNHVCKINKLVQANIHLVSANHSRTRNRTQSTAFFIDVARKVNICLCLESRRIQSGNHVTQSLFNIHLILVDKLHCNRLRSRELSRSRSLVSHLAVLNFIAGKRTIHGIVSSEHIDRAIEIHDRTRIRCFNKVLDNLGLVIRKRSNTHILRSFHHERKNVLLIFRFLFFLRRAARLSRRGTLCRRRRTLVFFLDRRRALCRLF